MAAQALGALPECSAEWSGGVLEWVWGLGLDRRAESLLESRKLEPPAGRAWVGAGAWPGALTAELRL